MWFICRDRQTNEVRRIVELSSTDKAYAISKYVMEGPFDKRPDVSIVPIEPIPVSNDPFKERILASLGINEDDVANIKDISKIKTDVDNLKTK